MKKMKCVILAAGAGTRMFPLTSDRPKPMLWVAGKTLIEHLFDRVCRSGIDHVFLVVPSASARIKEYFDSRRSQVKLTFVEQKNPYGTGDALMQCADYINDRFLCMNGDILVSERDIRGLLTCSDQGEVIAGYQSTHPGEYGVIVSSEGRLDHILEKPGSEVQNGLINAGIYVFDPDIFDALKKIERSPRGEYELTDALRSRRMDIYQIKDYWTDIGYPWDMLTANEIFLREMGRSRILGEVSKDATIRGPIWVGKGSEILPGTYIEGPVLIGEDCRVGPNAYIRPSTSIGDHCHIGASTEVKNSIIMHHSNAPHINYVGDSIIGENCNLGAGTKIANLRFDEQTISVVVKGKRVNTNRRKLGAIIGHNVKIGINASLSVGSIIGSDSYIGIGAVVSGTVQQNSRIY